MAKTFFITATATDVGKTYTTIRLLRAFAKRGVKAVPIKPIETGVDPVALDATKLQKEFENLYGEKRTLEAICPYRFVLPAAPYISQRYEKAPDIDLGIIDDAVQQAAQKADVVLIEGAGGLFVPILKDFFMIDCAKRYAQETILVSHTGLGCINDVMLSQNALIARNIPHKILFNKRENDDFSRISEPYLREIYHDLWFVDSIDDLVQAI